MQSSDYCHFGNISERYPATTSGLAPLRVSVLLMKLSVRHKSNHRSLRVARDPHYILIYLHLPSLLCNGTQAILLVTYCSCSQVLGTCCETSARLPYPLYRQSIFRISAFLYGKCTQLSKGWKPQSRSVPSSKNRLALPRVDVKLSATSARYTSSQARGGNR